MMLVARGTNSVDDEFCLKVVNECQRAIEKHGHFSSSHEALAVIWEEFEELKDEVFKQKADKLNLRTELVQIAAMCRRFYQEVEQDFSDYGERKKA